MLILCHDGKFIAYIRINYLQERINKCLFFLVLANKNYLQQLQNICQIYKFVINTNKFDN